MSEKAKKCSRCKETMSIKEFYKDKYKPDGYKYYCKMCCKTYRQSENGLEAQRRGDKKYRQSEKGKKNKRSYWQSEEGKEVKRRYNSSEKYKNARKRYNASEKGKKTVRGYERSIKGKDIKRRSAAIRRTRQTQSGGFYTFAEWYNLCKYYEFRCLRCNKQLPFEELTFDHIKPVSQGGSSDISNSQPLCMECNSKKGNKEIDYRKTLPDWINRDRPVWGQDRLF